mmetsp:Transcript_17312/g.25409  ORF Transcript_17312/g.25409 Transcript_17312/m.25409 type:complete len:81 (+) Transcript_17312:488-730(+)
MCSSLTDTSLMTFLSPSRITEVTQSSFSRFRFWGFGKNDITALVSGWFLFGLLRANDRLSATIMCKGVTSIGLLELEWLS